MALECIWYSANLLSIAMFAKRGLCNRLLQQITLEHLLLWLLVFMPCFWNMYVVLICSTFFRLSCLAGFINYNVLSYFNLKTTNFVQLLTD